VNSEKIYLAAPIQEMAAEAVKELIGEARYRAIKAQDPHPLFVTFSAGHEGESRGRIIARAAGFKPEAQPKRWSAERIRELARRLAKAPVYLFHNADNSPRRRIGEIVTAAARSLKGRLHAVGVAYIADPGAREQIRSGELDTCSIEAELEFSRERRAGSWLVDAVRKVTGLALGSRATATPGFPGAGLLAVVQEFEPEEKEAEKEISRLQGEIKDREERIGQLEAEVGRLQSTGEPGQLAAAVAKLVVERVGEEVRRLYSQAGMPALQPAANSFPAPPEPGRSEAVNPLIPKE
jgi:hypothetical protein